MRSAVSAARASCTAASFCALRPAIFIGEIDTWYHKATRHRGYFRRGFLNHAHVPHDQGGGEAAVALDLACSILDAADGCMGVLYDGAFRGMHRDVIARRGRLLINKQHKDTKPRYIRTLSYRRCRHEVWSSGGRVHERAYHGNGTSTLVPLPVRKLERRASAHAHRWYHLLTILRDPQQSAPAPTGKKPTKTPPPGSCPTTPPNAATTSPTGPP